MDSAVSGDTSVFEIGLGNPRYLIMYPGVYAQNSQNAALSGGV
jgi:hypothetical protein